MMVKITPAVTAEVCLGAATREKVLGHLIFVTANKKTSIALLFLLWVFQSRQNKKYTRFYHLRWWAEWELMHWCWLQWELETEWLQKLRSKG